MNRHLRFWAGLLVMLVPVVAPVRGFAANELFPPTEVTARYDFGLLQQALRVMFTPQIAREDGGYLSQHISLSDIEPAAGDEAEAHGGASDSHREETKAEEAPHDAHGGGSKKSFTGKDLSGPPPLPAVTIGGKTVVTDAQSRAALLESTVPDAFKKSSAKDFLERRFNITAFAHSPRRGDANAKIQVLQFVDLSCGQCMPELVKIDAALAAVSQSILVTHIHAPMERFQDTNMPAFYGKVADRQQLFWVYRDQIIANKPSDENAVFNELVRSGVDPLDVRKLMITDARRFYREMDADTLLARSFGVGRPPVLFVNGIRVGDAGIPLDNLPDVLTYVQRRIDKGIQEPPR